MKKLWCWRCEMEIPMLDEEEYTIARKLYSEAMQNMRINKEKPDFQPLLNYYNELTGFNETVHNAIMHHRIADYGPACENCGKPYRTRLASVCAACGNKRDLSVFNPEEMFYILGARHTNYVPDITSLWKEIAAAYAEPGRFYHNMEHLKHMLSELVKVKDNIEDWDALLFALYYHDFVYKALKTNNEAASAELAMKCLKSLGVSPQRMEHCKTMILATKHHQLHIQSDVNYFTDADLTILGQEWSVYVAYSENVKKEYQMVPGFLYRLNRKKVLRHFLATERIFKTDHFYQKYEIRARENIQQELENE